MEAITILQICSLQENPSLSSILECLYLHNADIKYKIVKKLLAKGEVTDV